MLPASGLRCIASSSSLFVGLLQKLVTVAEVVLKSRDTTFDVLIHGLV